MRVCFVFLLLALGCCFENSSAFNLPQMENMAKEDVYFIDQYTNKLLQKFEAALQDESEDRDSKMKCTLNDLLIFVGELSEQLHCSVEEILEEMGLSDLSIQEMEEIIQGGASVLDMDPEQCEGVLMSLLKGLIDLLLGLLRPLLAPFSAILGGLIGPEGPIGALTGSLLGGENGLLGGDAGGLLGGLLGGDSGGFLGRLFGGEDGGLIGGDSGGLLGLLGVGNDGLLGEILGGASGDLIGGPLGGEVCSLLNGLPGGESNDNLGGIIEGDNDSSLGGLLGGDSVGLLGGTLERLPGGTSGGLLGDGSDGHHRGTFVGRKGPHREAKDGVFSGVNGASNDERSGQPFGLKDEKLDSVGEQTHVSTDSIEGSGLYGGKTGGIIGDHREWLIFADEEGTVSEATNVDSGAADPHTYNANSLTVGDTEGQNVVGNEGDLVGEAAGKLTGGITGGEDGASRDIFAGNAAFRDSTDNINELKGDGLSERRLEKSLPSGIHEHVGGTNKNTLSDYSGWLVNEFVGDSRVPVGLPGGDRVVEGRDDFGIGALVTGFNGGVPGGDKVIGFENNGGVIGGEVGNTFTDGFTRGEYVVKVDNIGRDGVVRGHAQPVGGLTGVNTGRKDQFLHRDGKYLGNENIESFDEPRGSPTNTNLKREGQGRVVGGLGDHVSDETFVKAGSLGRNEGDLVRNAQHRSALDNTGRQYEDSRDGNGSVAVSRALTDSRFEGIGKDISDKALGGGDTSIIEGEDAKALSEGNSRVKDQDLEGKNRHVADKLAGVLTSIVPAADEALETIFGGDGIVRSLTGRILGKTGVTLIGTTVGGGVGDVDGSFEVKGGETLGRDASRFTDEIISGENGSLGRIIEREVAGGLPIDSISGGEEIIGGQNGNVGATTEVRSGNTNSGLKEDRVVDAFNANRNEGGGSFEGHHSRIIGTSTVPGRTNGRDSIEVGVDGELDYNTSVIERVGGVSIDIVSGEENLFGENNNSGSGGGSVHELSDEINNGEVVIEGINDNISGDVTGTLKEYKGHVNGRGGVFGGLDKTISERDGVIGEHTGSLGAGQGGIVEGPNGIVRGGKVGTSVGGLTHGLIDEVGGFRDKGVSRFGGLASRFKSGMLGGEQDLFGGIIGEA